jgi:hypothetical protein
MKRIAILLAFVSIIISTHAIHAQVVSPSGDIEVLITSSTTRSNLVQFTQELQAQGFTLKVNTATFNSANQVMTLSFEVIQTENSELIGKFESMDMRNAGDVWIIINDSLTCVGDCK